MEPERTSLSIHEGKKTSASQSRRELLALLLIIGAPALVYACVFGSPWFRLEKVRIEGNSRRVPRIWVESQLASFREQNLLRASRVIIEQRLHENPWIDSVHIRKELPDRLHLIIRERRAIALLAVASDRFVFVDSEGRPIAPADGEKQAGKHRLLRVYNRSSDILRGEALQGALTVKGSLAQAAPEMVARLSFVEIMGDGAFRLAFQDLPFRVLVTVDRTEVQIRSLCMILPELLRRYENLESVDLRFDREVVLVFRPPQ